MLGTVSVHLTEFQRAISRQCSYIGYVPSIGQVLCIDDDAVRTCSPAFESVTGMPLVNIPDKGMGANQNVCIAMPSGFFLGGALLIEG